MVPGEALKQEVCSDLNEFSRANIPSLCYSCFSELHHPRVTHGWPIISKNKNIERVLSFLSSKCWNSFSSSLPPFFPSLSVKLKKNTYTFICSNLFSVAVGLLLSVCFVYMY